MYLCGAREVQVDVDLAGIRVAPGFVQSPHHDAAKRARAAGTGTWGCVERHGDAATRGSKYLGRTLSTSADGAEGDRNAGDRSLAASESLVEHDDDW